MTGTKKKSNFGKNGIVPPSIRTSYGRAEFYFLCWTMWCTWVQSTIAAGIACVDTCRATIIKKLVSV